MVDSKDKQRVPKYQTVLDTVAGQICLVTIVPVTKLSEFLRDNTERYDAIVNGRIEYALSA